MAEESSEPELISFFCSNQRCGAVLKVEPGYPEKFLECDECGTEVRVPGSARRSENLSLGERFNRWGRAEMSVGTALFVAAAVFLAGGFWFASNSRKEAVDIDRLIREWAKPQNASLEQMQMVPKIRVSHADETGSELVFFVYQPVGLDRQKSYPAIIGPAAAGDGSPDAQFCAQAGAFYLEASSPEELPRVRERVAAHPNVDAQRIHVVGSGDVSDPKRRADRLRHLAGLIARN